MSLTDAQADAVAAFVRGTRDASLRMEQAGAADARGVHGPLLQAALAVCAKDRAAFAALDACLDDAATLAASTRERRHFEAAYAWRCGEPREALRCYSAIAADDPLDLLALRLAQSCAFYIGDEQAMLAVTTRALPAWEEGMRGMDALLAMHAFALDENGDVEAAEACARRALELEADNPAAIHAIAHVLAARGWADRGVDWLESHARVWRIGSPVAGHLAWHLAILHVQRGHPARALVLYDSLLAPRPHHSPADLADAAGLLWRMELCGAPAGDRWQAVAAAFARRSPPFLWPLLDAHAAAAFAFAGHEHALRSLVAALERQAAAGTHQGEVAQKVTLPLIRRLQARSEATRGQAASSPLPYESSLRADLLSGRHDTRGQVPSCSPIPDESLLRADLLSRDELPEHAHRTADFSALAHVAALGGSRLQREIVARTLGDAAPDAEMFATPARYARAA
jgi:tetratricopeptide (TPR) repeat protein